MAKPKTYIYKIGTDENEDLIGSGAAEWMEGRGGKDRLYGRGGDDVLYGGSGNDLLDGGAGLDLMYGGSGDDIYVVDRPGDVVSEETTPGVDDGGTDYVYSFISYTLGPLLERMDLKGTASIHGTGNGGSNSLKGNDAANVLSGLGGVDTLVGGAGDDTLIGGAGKDYITGGTGSDTFVIGPPDPSSADRIYDFAAEDRIGLYASDYMLVEGSGTLGNTLDPRYFTIGTAATSVGHGQFVYNQSTAKLLWDPDGKGGASALEVASLTSGAVLTFENFTIMTERPSVSISPFQPEPQAEDSGSMYFMISLSAPAREDVIVTYSTVGDTAGAQDFVAGSSKTVVIPAGTMTAYVAIELLDDDIAEGLESFEVRIDSARLATSGHTLATGAAATGTISDEGPVVAKVHDLAALGIPDPSGLAYDPGSGAFYLSDAEIDEAPFNSTTDMWRLSTGGSLEAAYSLSFTREATGLAIDPVSRTMFISDDDQFKISAVSLDAPGTVLWEFDTRSLGAYDPEDVAVDPINGRLFIVNGSQMGTPNIIETNFTGTQVFRTITLPSEISDPEALAYDPREEAFYVGGGFSATVWKLDPNGSNLAVIGELWNHYHPTNNTRVHVKDLELAPSSDGSGEMRLYVADFGWDKVMDGRLFELDLGDTGSPGWLLV
jgi:hypothetical protein